MLVDRERNMIVAGLNFDVSAEDVLELCVKWSAED
jgi:hypothetical protein